jgi:hypothetical protein
VVVVDALCVFVKEGWEFLFCPPSAVRSFRALIVAFSIDHSLTMSSYSDATKALYAEEAYTSKCCCVPSILRIVKCFVLTCSRGARRRQRERLRRHRERLRLFGLMFHSPSRHSRLRRGFPTCDSTLHGESIVSLLLSICFSSHALYHRLLHRRVFA